MSKMSTLAEWRSGVNLLDWFEGQESWVVPPLQLICCNTLLRCCKTGILRDFLSKMSSRTMFVCLLVTSLKHQLVKKTLLILSLWPWEELWLKPSRIIPYAVGGAEVSPLYCLIELFMDLISRGVVRKLNLLDIGGLSICPNKFLKIIRNRGSHSRSIAASQAVLDSFAHMKAVENITSAKTEEALKIRGCKKYTMKVKYLMYINHVPSFQYLFDTLMKIQYYKIKESCVLEVEVTSLCIVAPLDIMNVLRESRYAEKIRALDGMKDLDLYIQPYSSDTSVTTLSRVLSVSPHITALYLSRHNLQGKIEKLFSALEEGLESLEVKGCNLSGKDLLAIRNSRHTRTLKVLDLSHNDFSACGENLVQLILSLTPSLEVLRLACCIVHKDDCSPLFRALGICELLTFLDVSCNDLIYREDGLPEFLLLAALPNLQYFQITHPVTPMQRNDLWQNRRRILEKRFLDYRTICTKKSEFVRRVFVRAVPVSFDYLFLV